MTVVTFVDYLPLERLPPVFTPWTGVVIEQSASPLGPWTLISSFDLDPLDADPAAPQLRSFSTAAGTIDDGWYRVGFTDEEGNVEYADPVRNRPPAPGALYATAAELRAELGLTALEMPDEDAWPLLADATDAVDAMLGAWPTLHEGAWAGRKIDLAAWDLGDVELSALSRATVKAARALREDPVGAAERPRTSVSGPDFSESYAEGAAGEPRLSREARRVLVAAGLVRGLTTGSPQPLARSERRPLVRRWR